MSRDYKKYEIEEKTHYKLYKSGKNWITAGITVFSLGLGLTFTQLDQVHAATQSSSSDSDSSVSSDTSNTSAKTVVLKSSDTSSDATPASGTNDTTSQSSSSASDSQATSAAQSSSAASGVTDESESASKSATSTTNSTSSSATSESSTASSATVGSSSQDKSAKTTSTSTSESSTASSTKSSVEATSSAQNNTNESATANSAVSGNSVVDNVASVASNQETVAGPVVTQSSANVNEESLATNAETTVLAEVVSSNVLKSKLSLLRATADTTTTPTVTYVNGQVALNYSIKISVASIADLLDNQNNTVAEDKNLALYIQDADGNYLQDVNGKKVNILSLILSYEDYTGFFSVKYTNSNGVQFDVSDQDLSTLKNAGKYELTLTDAGKDAINGVISRDADQYDLPDDIDLSKFVPVFSTTPYTFNVTILPATIVSGNNDPNSATLVKASDKVFDGTLGMIPYTVSVYRTEGFTDRALLIKNGVVSIADTDTNTTVGTTIFTAADFDYTYTGGTNLTGADTGTYTITLNAKGKAALQAALGDNFALDLDDTYSNTGKITAAPVSVTTSSKTVTYNGSAQGTTVSTTGTLYNQFNFTTSTGTNVNTSTNYPDGYKMTAILADANQVAILAKNYTVTETDGTLTINPAAATITIPNKTYWADGTTKNLTATVTGTVNGESLNYKLTDDLQTVGTKTISATYDTTDPVNANYNITVVPGTVTVGDVTVEYDYGYVGTDGKFVSVASEPGQASHGTDATASDYLAYTTTPEQAKTGYTLASNNTGLAANGTLSGTGGVVKYIYLANTETANVIYYDQTDGKELTTVALSGQYGTTDAYTTADAIAAYEKAGYKLVSSDFPSVGITYDTDGSVQSYKVLLSHKTATVNVDHPGTPGDPIDPDNPTGPKYPAETDTASLSSTSKRTINYIYATDKATAADSTVQTVTYTRTATIDEVNGTVSYSNWATTDNNYGQVTSPIIAGYTPDQASVAMATANQGDADTMALVTYTANQESATVTFIDTTTGAQLDKVALTGDYDTTSDYSPKTTIDGYLKAGYQLDSSDVPASGITFDVAGTVKAYTIKLSHKTATVNIDHPGTPGQPIESTNPNGPKYPAGTDTVALGKTITRTIKYQYQDGTSAGTSVQQQVGFDRTATIDEVTGAVTYGQWLVTGTGKSTGSYEQVKTPVIDGYTADTDAVGTAIVTSSASDGQVMVTYLANVAHAGSAKVVYMDATTGKELASKTLVGEAGTHTDYSTQATIDQYVKAGYVLVRDGFPTSGIVFTDGTGQTYTVYLVHGKVPSTDQSQLTKVVTQTIHYRDQQGNTIHPDTTRSIMFTRSGIVDQVTGEITYSDWQTADNTEFSIINAPELAGYSAVTKATQLIVVNATSGNDDQTLTYEKVEASQPTQSAPATIKTGNTPVVPTQMPQPVTTSQPAKIVVAEASHDVKLVKATHEQPAAKRNQAKTLPQTNDDQQADFMMELLGLSLATLLIGYGFVSRKRRN